MQDPQALELLFPSSDQVTVRLGSREVGPVDFRVPLGEAQVAEIGGYLSTLIAERDRGETLAKHLAAKAAACGEALYRAVFDQNPDAHALAAELIGRDGNDRCCLIRSDSDLIQGLPWELLRAPGQESWLQQDPPIAIHRHPVAEVADEATVTIEGCARLRVLCLVPRPNDREYVDHRALPAALMKAAEGLGRVDVEVLRPASLAALKRRLEAVDRPTVSIVAVDTAAELPSEAQAADGEGGEARLVVERSDGATSALSAQRFGQLVGEHGVSLVLLCGAGSMPSGVPLSILRAGAPAVVTPAPIAGAAQLRMMFAALLSALTDGGSVAESVGYARAKTGYPAPAWMSLAFYRREADPTPIVLSVGALGAAGPSDGTVASRGRIHGIDDKLSQSGRFVGRGEPLLGLEQRLAKGVSVLLTGPEGQGKTALAVELLRWGSRTGLIGGGCFVSFARCDREGAVEHLTSELGEALGRSLQGPVTTATALREECLWLVLDAIDALAPEQRERLLGFVAACVELADCPLLMTSRDRVEPGPCAFELVEVALPPLSSAEALGVWRASGGQGDAAAVSDLFARVSRRPAAVHLLSRRLKHESANALDSELAAMSPPITPQKLRVAALARVSERLGEDIAAYLPRLGVFRGGGMEDLVLRVITARHGGRGGATGISIWRRIKQELVAAGLVRVRSAGGGRSAYVHVDPRLGELLWDRLALPERASVLRRHGETYRRFAAQLEHLDDERAGGSRRLVEQELDNLLFAIDNALSANQPDVQDWINQVCALLGPRAASMGCDSLRARALVLAAQSPPRADELDARLRCARTLLADGESAAAMDLLRELQEHASVPPSLEHALVIGLLGRALAALGRDDEAAIHLEASLEEAAYFADDAELRAESCEARRVLADLLEQRGETEKALSIARSNLDAAREDGLTLARGDVDAQIGLLELANGNLAEAEVALQHAAERYAEVGDYAGSGRVLHALGRLYREAGQAAVAEQALRQAAQTIEQQALEGQPWVDGVWHDLAELEAEAGREDAAEGWMHKALAAALANLDAGLVAQRQLALAQILVTCGKHRLDESRRLAERCLQTAGSLNDDSTRARAAALLAEVAEQVGDYAAAAAYRRISPLPESLRPDEVERLMPHRALLTAAMMALQSESSSAVAVLDLAALDDGGERPLSDALQLMGRGERDAIGLMRGLAPLGSLAVRALLLGLEDPAKLGEVVDLQQLRGFRGGDDPGPATAFKAGPDGQLPRIDPPVRGSGEVETAFAERLLRAGYAQRAVDAYAEGLRKHGVGFDRTRALMGYARSHVELGDPKRALGLCDMAVDEISSARGLAKTGVNRLVAEARLYQADVLMNLGREREAQRSLALAEKSIRSLRDARLAALVDARQGRFAFLDGDNKTALRRLGSAAEALEGRREPLEQAQCLMLFAEVLVAESRLERAEEALRRALEILQGLGRYGTANGADGVWLALGELALLRKRPGKAVTLFRKAVLGARRSGDRAELCRRLEALGQALWNGFPHYIDEAREVLNEALASLPRLAPIEQRERIRETLAEIADTEGDFELAQRLRRERGAVDDELG